MINFYPSVLSITKAIVLQQADFACTRGQNKKTKRKTERNRNMRTSIKRSLSLSPPPPRPAALLFPHPFHPEPRIRAQNMAS